ncbi:unnamed protein product [Rhizophagus irregularis]|nr:unnamed protein product [Rhizophagus irregularis]
MQCQLKVGAKNDTLFYYGGLSSVSTMALVYTFDPQHIELIDYSGKLYLWGGISNNIIVNDMLIFDTINFSWGKGSSVNAPTQRYHFGATLLPNNKIIYMGGVDDITSSFYIENFIY